MIFRVNIKYKHQILFLWPCGPLNDGKKYSLVLALRYTDQIQIYQISRISNHLQHFRSKLRPLLHIAILVDV